jgi:hypothetical protein
MLAESLDPDAYDWEFRPRFVAELLQPMDACRGEIPYEGPAHWVAWLDAEAAYWDEEGEPRDYAAMARWWLSDPSKAPVIAVLQSDDMACVIDGAHRTAVAHAAGRRTVPVILGTPRRGHNPAQFYWDVPPTASTDVPWADEMLDDLRPALEDAQIRMLLGRQAMYLIDRLATAPERDKWFERVDRSEIDPVEYAGADEGWYLDQISGRHVVLEDDPVVTRGGPPYWVRELPFPEGAIQVGELVLLESLLWKASDKAAELADDDLLTPSQRKAAVELAKAAGHLSLRLQIKQMHLDPEKAKEVKRAALEVLAHGRPPLRLVNRKKSFGERKHDWDEVLVSTPKVRITRGELRHIYLRNSARIVDAIKAYDALVLIGIGKNRTILRRHGPNGKNIRITKVEGIEDPSSLEYWANRRLVELHRVVGQKTDVVWVDLDPKDDGDLRQLVRKVVPKVERVMRSVYPKARIVSWDSGKRGVHVEGYLPSKVDVDAARRKLRKALEAVFAGDPRFTTGIAKVGQVRLDVTTLKRTGSVRAPWTPTVEGRVKRPL